MQIDVTESQQIYDNPIAALEPSIAALNDGRSAIVWTAARSAAILMQIMDENGQPEGSVIRVTDAGESANRPAVALLDNGHFVVTYTNFDTSKAKILARSFDLDGTPVGGASTVFANVNHLSYSPESIARPDGGYLTVFTNFGLDGDAFSLHMRMIDGNGHHDGPAIRVNQTTESVQSGGEAAFLEDGSFVVTWHSREVDGSFYAIMMRRYDADGTPLTNEIRVNQYSYLSQYGPDIAVLSDGRFVITWDSDGQDGSGEGVFGRIYSAEGFPIGGEFRINWTTSLGQENAAVIALPGGGFFVAWDHEVAHREFELRGQAFDRFGNPSGDETVLYSGPHGMNLVPDLAIGTDGVVRAAWVGGERGEDFFVFSAQIDITRENSVRSDVTGDGSADILFQKPNGSVFVWQMDTGRAVEVKLGGLSDNWTIESVADLTGDGTSDMLIRKSNGNVAILKMDSGTPENEIVGGLKAAWTIEGTGDLTGDGIQDVLIRNSNNYVIAWEMDTGSKVQREIGGLGDNWAVEGLGDFTGDGTSDVLLRKSNGNIAIWEMDSGAKAFRLLGGVKESWSVVGIGDVTGDGVDDIVFQKPNGVVVAWNMDSGSRVQNQIGGLNDSWTIEGVADVTGDGSADILFRNDAGNLAAWEMDSGARQFGLVGTLDTDWDVLI